MKKCFVLLLLLIFPLCLSAEERMTRAQYIAKYKGLAIMQMKESGIPASITLAQGCLESADGNSTLAREANNHFGIKCHGWDGASVYQDDDKANECFRKYDSVEDSFRDHSEFLRTRDRYSALFSLESTDYKGWAFGLKAAGYATASDYAQRLIKIIEDNGLDKYDLTNPEPSDQATVDLSAEVTRPDVPKTEESAVSSFTLYLHRAVYSLNGVDYIVTNGYDTYRSLAREYRLFKKELLRFNDLDKDEPIPSGSRVFIELKKKEAQKDSGSHIVKEGETMRDLSQQYAVRLKSLYKLNNITPGQKIEPGMTIKLRRQ